MDRNKPTFRSSPPNKNGWYISTLKARGNNNLSGPKNKIIFLPQTIFYKTEENILDTAVILNKHKDLTIYLRDDISLQTANKYFTNSKKYLCPDMATFLYPLDNKFYQKRRDKELFLLRDDIEQTDNHISIPKTAWKGDWTDIIKPMNLVVRIIQLSILFLGRILGEKLHRLKK